MTDRQSFLNAIRQAPDDDAPRLVYADWLDERGEWERAELIRVQCRMAALEAGTTLDAKEYSRLWDQLPTLLTPQNFWRWFDVPGWPGSPTADVWSGGDVMVGYGRGHHREQWCVGIRRGFWTLATLPAADWLAHGDAILAGHPVAEVRLTTWPEWSVSQFIPGWYRIPGRQGQPHSVREHLTYHAGCQWLIAQEWPSVKTWHLPPHPDHPRDGRGRWTTSFGRTPRGASAVLRLA